ncbi:MAG: hypothetical protein RLZZ301_1094 [Bacteroidota bacterium]|jgi:RNA polymerase sigma-70 factor (ECF subfamily)
MQLNERQYRLLLQQDPQMVKEWYLQTYPFLMQRAARFFDNKDEQLTAVHNAQLKALKHLKTYKSTSSMWSWLSVILRNELIDLYRKEQRWKRLFSKVQSQGNEEMSIDEQLDAAIELEKVQQHLLVLPKTTRFVFSFVVFEELSPKEIAAALQMPIDTVRWHLKIARRILKTHVHE